MTVNYTYNARVTKVIDGDTLELSIDLGFRITTVQRARVLGIDTPEMFSGTTAERAEGKWARSVTWNWCLARDNIVVVTTQKTDSFGRWLADVKSLSGENLTEFLLSKGYKAYV